MLFESARSRRMLEYYCEKVARMQPGQFLAVDRHELCDIETHEHNGATFTAADRVLGNIVGSAYTHSHTLSPDGRKVVFERHQNTGKVRYRDPDRRYMDMDRRVAL